MPVEIMDDAPLVPPIEEYTPDMADDIPIVFVASSPDSYNSMLTLVKSPLFVFIRDQLRGSTGPIEVLSPVVAPTAFTEALSMGPVTPEFTSIRLIAL